MHRSTIFLLLLSLACTACVKQPDDYLLLKPPLRPGEILDLNSQYAKTWPGKPALFKLKDNLILAVPPQYQGFWAQSDWLTGKDLMVRPPMPLDKIPVSESSGFQMHLPNYDGYRPDNYLNQFDVNLVQVIDIHPVPTSTFEIDASGSFPPNVLKRIVEDKAIDLEKYQNREGLRCYVDTRLIDTRGSADREFCYGKRDDLSEEFLYLYIDIEPMPSWKVFPMMRVRYSTKKYGGLEIIWWSHVQNLSRWREIDGEVWKHIAAWNVAPTKAPATITHPQPTKFQSFLNIFY